MNLKISCEMSEEEAVQRWLNERGLCAAETAVISKLSSDSFARGEKISTLDVNTMTYRAHPEAKL